jgi:transcriptional regulator with XRE-family HTH domain
MTEKELHKIFSGNLRKFRVNADWSQVTLAKKAGVSINFINDMESGKKWASPATMLKIANVFDVHVYELLKPDGLFPDNLGSIIKQYTDNIHTALDDACSAFLEDADHAASLK